MRARHSALLVAVFVTTFLYRFNTLGGSSAGFDNQHFLFLVYAREILAGAQPLRDVLDAGLQGAWPSLSYELPARAQQALGENLRSEAFLTVGAIAAATALTFAAARRVAAWPWALLTTLLSVWIAPKLYSYPKVLVLAGASYLALQYASRPTWRTVTAMGAWTAIGFLFRHDLAVYCGIAFCAAIVAVAGQRELRTAVWHSLGYAAVTVTLLAPSIWWIERYIGVYAYLRAGWAMSAREAERTDLSWPTPTLEGVDSLGQWFATEANAEAWLYYLFVGVPLLTLARLWRCARRQDADAAAPALISLSMMALVLVGVYLRGSLEARFGDMVPPVAVLGAALLNAGVGFPRSWRHAAVAGFASLVLAATISAIWSLQSVASELRTSGFSVSPAAVVRRAVRISAELTDLPHRVWDDPDVGYSWKAAQYLHRCTRASDRVLVVGFAPDVLMFSGRRFAGGRASFIPGFYDDERYTRRALAALSRESVPLALAEPEAYYRSFPLLAAYLRERYVEAGAVTLDGGAQLRILAERGRAARPYGPMQWPCFS